MTAKEKLLERVMSLSEAEADEALRLFDARRDEAEDEWGSRRRCVRSHSAKRCDAWQSPSAPPATSPGEAGRQISELGKWFEPNLAGLGTTGDQCPNRRISGCRSPHIWPNVSVRSGR
jgi:hypothetical protein